MAIPELELDDKLFIVLASAPGIALVQHKITGSYAIFRLHWRCSGMGSAFFNDEAQEAWEQYVKEVTT